MQKRLFTSPVMKVSQVRLWCQKIRDNKSKVLLKEIEFESALDLLPTKKTKAAS